MTNLERNISYKLNYLKISQQIFTKMKNAFVTEHSSDETHYEKTFYPSVLKFMSGIWANLA